MPVKIGDNLTLEDNKLSAVYKELYTKLNKAYAWTSTSTTSSGGTAVLLTPSNEIKKLIECPDINSINMGDGSSIDGSGNRTELFIINNDVYGFGDIPKRTETNNLKQVQYSSNYVIDKNGYLYFLPSISASTTNWTLSKVGTSNTWQKFTKGDVNYAYCVALNNGEIYRISSTTETKLDVGSGYEDISGVGYNVYALKNGCIYHGYMNYTNPTLTLVSEINNFIKMWCPYNYINAITDNLELYYISGSSVVKVCNLFSVNDIIKGTLLVSNGKLYRLSSTQQSASITLINSSLNWTDCSPSYAIGDGKLYYVSGNTLTQVGTNTNYVKLFSPASRRNDQLVEAIAWTGESVTDTHTVYTSRTQEVGDNLYSDINLTVYSTLNSKSNNTITDSSRTYTKDNTKNTSFNKIPLTTVRETVSVLDLLNATNPNN